MIFNIMINELLTLQTQLRIFHWQTKSYSAHQALGITYDFLSLKIDEFVEVFMGKNGRISVNKMTINLEDLSDGNLEVFVDKMIEYLQTALTDNINETDTDLINIRDEMLASMNKLKYLLTLE